MSNSKGLKPPRGFKPVGEEFAKTAFIPLNMVVRLKCFRNPTLPFLSVAFAKVLDALQSQMSHEIKPKTIDSLADEGAAQQTKCLTIINLTSTVIR